MLDVILNIVLLEQYLQNSITLTSIKSHCKCINGRIKMFGQPINSAAGSKVMVDIQL